MEKNWRQVKRKRSFSLICPRSGRGGGGWNIFVEKNLLFSVITFLSVSFFVLFFFLCFFVCVCVFIFCWLICNFILMLFNYKRNKYYKKKKEKKCKKKTEKKQKRKSLLFLPSFVRLLLKVEICFACKCNY